VTQQRYTGAMTPADEPERRLRIDKWLWHARFMKTRSLAAAAVGGGKVKVGGERVKSAHNIKVGDRLQLQIADESLEIDVLALPVRRGPAIEAQACYAETADSAARRAVHREQRRIANLGLSRPDSKPDKRERRALDKLRRGQV